MGEAAARGPADMAFAPNSNALPVCPTTEPVLGKLFQFTPPPRKTYSSQSIPSNTGCPIPEKVDPIMACPVPMAPPMPPSKPPAVATAASPEEPERTWISAERLAFLERVEELMAVKSEVSDLKTENKTLISIVSRLQRELDQLKGAHKA